MTPIELDHDKGLNGAVAGELRAERSRQRVTFDTLADATQISRRTLIRILNGERAINMATLEAICEALDVRVSDVVGVAQAQVAQAQPAVAAEVVEFPRVVSDVEIAEAVERGVAAKTDPNWENETDQ